jgi:hypothetical protein
MMCTERVVAKSAGSKRIPANSQPIVNPLSYMKIEFRYSYSIKRWLFDMLVRNENNVGRWVMRGS